MPTNLPPKPAMPAAAKPAPTMGGKALVGLACLALGLVVGYGAGRVSTGTPINPLAPSGQQPAPQAPGAPGAPLAEDPNAPPPLESSTSISGTAVAATASSLTFDADLRPFDPSGKKDLPVRRTATLSSSTVIIRLVEKTPQEFNADQQAFSESIADGPSEGPPPTPPSIFKEVPIAATDISAGEMITVTAEEDIVAAETFVATRVVVAPKPPEQPVLPPPVPQEEPERPPQEPQP